jgi:CRP-like cAMP-binding protein
MVRAVEPTAETLRTLPLFAGLDQATLERLAERAVHVQAPAGSVLVEVGQPGSGLLVLEEGELTVELPSGEVVSLAPGAFVGELSLLIDEPRSARVRASTEVRCVAVARADFQALLADEPQVAVAMLPVLARRLFEQIA